MTPLGRAGGGDPEQRGDDGLPPAPHKLVGDRQPDRRSDERAVDQHEDRSAHPGMHRRSISLHTLLLPATGTVRLGITARSLPSAMAEARAPRDPDARR